MKIYLVEAEHFEIPGRHLRAFCRETDAQRDANEQANLIIKDACETSGKPFKPLPLDASGERRARALAKHIAGIGYECNAYADVIELQVYP
jgi:hypothetical protein